MNFSIIYVNMYMVERSDNMEKKNEYQARIIELLNKYIEETHNKKQKLEEAKMFKSLYEELLRLLEDRDTIDDNRLYVPLLLTTLYKNDIYLDRFYSLLPNLKDSKEHRKEYKALVNKIHQDYLENEKTIESLDTQLKRSNYLISTAKRVRYNLRFNLPITEYKYDITNIKTILDYYATIGEISNKELLLLINEIEMYNCRVLSDTNKSTKETEYKKTFYNDVPNILNAGYQKHDEVEVYSDRKPMLDKFAKEIISCIEQLDKQTIIENIESYQKYKIDDNEYNYILIKILDNCLDDLITQYEILSDKDIFLKIKDRLEVIRDYYKKLDIYLFLRNYYESVNEYKEEEIEEETEEEINEEPSSKDIEPRRLIYALSPNNNLKVRLLTDMNDIPKEYYEKLQKLLEDFKFKKRDSSIIKTLKGRANGKSFKELKDDQIRVVYKQIDENTFIIVGVFVKKDDNVLKKYKEIKNRAIPTFDTPGSLQRYLELASQVEAELSEKVKNEGCNYSR